MLLATLSMLAIVAQDAVPLRAAAADSAQQHAQLWQGESLEVRGERLDYLQVYDHRRERLGYVRASQVRLVDPEPSKAPELLAVLRFLKDASGSEALGIAYAAAYLQAAPAEAIDAELFDAMGSMADRLAARASARKGGAMDATLAEHLAVAGSYGIQWKSFERDGRIQTCYDGEAFRRVLALPSEPAQRARAALGLTRHECIPPDLPPLDRAALHQWRADVLDRAETESVPGLLRNRLQMRRAGVWAALAHNRSRRDQDFAAAANRALSALAGVHPDDLADNDRNTYSEAAVRVGASRWAAESVPAGLGGLRVETQAGQPGETCVLLLDRRHDAAYPLLRQCTYGTVWAASASVNSTGTALALSVQPLESWTELWLFRKEPAGWTVKVLPPAVDVTHIGYAEFAGWVPGNERMLVAREALVAGRWKKGFELIKLDTLATVARADKPESLSSFYRWQSPRWKQGTVSVR